MPGVDAPDFVKNIIIITGGGLGQDFPDWTDGIVQITSPQQFTDFPDWTKAQIVAPGGGGGGGGPNPVPGSIFWVDAQSITGLTDGQTVASWTDKSGHGHTATDVALSRPPQYHSSTAAFLINGQPTVFFSGDASSSTTLATNSFAVNMPFTVGVVYRSQGATATARSVVCDGSTTQPLFGFTASPAPFVAGDLQEFTANATPAAGPHMIIYVYNGASTAFYLDGVADPLTISAAPTGTNIANGLQLGEAGNGGGLNCVVGEIMLWPFAFTTTQLSQQYSYFHIRWGI